MATYVIGDVQGCFAAFSALLKKIDFQSSRDRLWFTGDLVNRGPQSLEVLRFVHGLGEKQIVVLGNHDLHLLAVSEGMRARHPNDTLEILLQAKDSKTLLNWLRHRPLIYHDKQFACVISHAGIAPMWDLDQAKQLAGEVETVLRSENYRSFLKEMYGDQPDFWEDNLSGVPRLRCIVNYLTRMRFCTPAGRLDLTFKGQIVDKPPHLLPWFDVPKRIQLKEKIIFGHWAALGGKVDVPNLYALDTGCVWGNCLTALRLDDWQRFTVDCS